MFIRLDGSRYIAFTEDDSVVQNFNIAVGDHFTLLADDGSGAAPMAGVSRSLLTLLLKYPHTQWTVVI